MINKFPLQSSTFRIYIILFLGGISLIFNAHFSTIKDIAISILIVSSLVFSTKFLKRQDNVIVGIIITTLVGFVSYLILALGSGLQNIELLANTRSRVQLIFNNPNFLANFIITLYTSSFILLSRERYHFLPYILHFIIPLTILFTGSRITLVSYTIITLFFLLQNMLDHKQKMFWLILSMAIQMIFAFTIFKHYVSTEEMIISNNLLQESEYLQKGWRVYDDSIVEITTMDNELSPSGYNIHKIKVNSQSHALFLLSDVKKSLSNEIYIASISLRSDLPQTIILSTHLSYTICSIEKDWSRCITPPAIGNDSSMLQFRLETVSPQQNIDFYLAEPQMEIGEQPTDYVLKTKPDPLYFLSQRLVPLVISNLDSQENEEISNNSLAGRPEAWSKGWNLFLQHPLLGVGSGNFAKYEDTEITHSHNIFIQILATQGLVGFVMWFAVGFIMLSSMTARQRRDFFPMLMVAFLMNLTDYTFIHASSLYVFFFTWGCVYFNKIYPEVDDKELVSG